MLQGYGVTVDLVGTTFISKAGITPTLKAVPDIPVGTFELNLPEEQLSALAANLLAEHRGSFCGQSSRCRPRSSRRTERKSTLRPRSP